ncbi:MAG: hypothetical protein ACJ74Q_15070 [Pyrinomonadaceae bacterium]
MATRYVPLELIEKMSLYCGEGTSDKVYHISLTRVDEGFINIIYYGRRIDDIADEDKSKSSLSYTTKPERPTTFAKAKKDFDEKTDEKLKKKRYEFYQTGHVVNTQSSMYAPTGSPAPTPVAQAMLVPVPRVESALAGTGYIPQLLNPTTLGGCEAFFIDPNYWASPKADGDRFQLGHRAGVVAASNRSGEGTSVAEHLSAALMEVAEASGQMAGLCFDGERIGRVYYVFDLLEYDGQPLSPPDGRGEYTRLPYFARVGHLQRIERAYRAWLDARGRTGKPDIRFIPIARTEAAKRKLFREVEASAGEGVVFTHIQSLNTPGKPNAGGLRHKYKFTKELDCVVVTTDRRSFESFVYHEGRLTSLGFVASGITDAIYEELAAAERRGETRVAIVRYLYGTGQVAAGGKMFQSTFLRFRSDKKPAECLSDQLEVKNPDALEEIKVEEDLAA